MPDNEILNYVTLRDSDHKSLLFALSQFYLNENVDAEFFGLIASVAETVVKYKLIPAPGRTAGSLYKSRAVSLHMDWDDNAFPHSHKITTELYLSDGVTKIGDMHMDTIDSPILR